MDDRKYKIMPGASVLCKGRGHLGPGSLVSEADVGGPDGVARMIEKGKLKDLTEERAQAAKISADAKARAAKDAAEANAAIEAERKAAEPVEEKGAKKAKK